MIPLEALARIDSVALSVFADEQAGPAAPAESLDNGRLSRLSSAPFVGSSEPPLICRSVLYVSIEVLAVGSRHHRSTASIQIPVAFFSLINCRLR